MSPVESHKITKATETRAIADEPIPVYTNLTEVFTSTPTALTQIARWNTLAEEYEARFGFKPEWIVRAPGRVNLIGEHIDYSLFGVLPAAIEPDILIACGPSASTSGTMTPPSSQEEVVAENTHPSYPRKSFTPRIERSWDLGIDASELRWESYVKAGYYGVLERYFPLDSSKEKITGSGPVPVNLLVTGSVPAGSGLSSSAAMVVASSLAFLAVNGKLEGGANLKDGEKSLTKGELVKMAMENEKRVGVNSGGMDQASSILSLPTAALYISFHPGLHAAPVALPAQATFVIANSLVRADKARGARRGYNLRVVEVLVGARVLAQALGLDKTGTYGKDGRETLREVVGRYAGENPVGGRVLSEEELEAAIRRVLDGGGLEALKPPMDVRERRTGVTKDEMAVMSGLERGELEKVFFSWIEVEAEHFELYKRAKHVLEEALRVLEFRRICLGLTSSSTGDDTDSLIQLGALMNASQESCRDLYECSCPEVDELVRIARGAGAVGSRVTGAGWGGCTVSLVPSHLVESSIAKVKEEYYGKRHPGLTEQELAEAIFGTKPGRGACVLKL